MVGLLGSAGRLGFVAAAAAAASLLAFVAPCGAVFFGVRLGLRGIPGNVLFGEIYILACSEPSLQPTSQGDGSHSPARSQQPAYV